MSVLFWLLAAAWVVFTLNRIRALFAVPVLRSLESLGGPAQPLPKVSVIVAARNEEARIRRTVLDLIRQVGVDVEVLVADDRSTDGTAELLQSLSELHDRLKVIRIDELPEGWLGKPHACHVAAQQARGDWLLFSDADVWMASDVLARAVRVASDEGADHLCLFPGEHRPSLLGKAVMLWMTVVFLPLSARLNRDKPRSFLGIGAFNLVRAEAYRAVGGHEPLRFEVIDDVKLGLLLARAGCRSRVRDANREIEVDWAGNVVRLFHVVEKNMFALIGFRVSLAALGVVIPGAVWLVSVLAPLSGTPAGLTLGAAVASMMVPGAWVARRMGWGPWPVLLSPLMAPIPLAALAHSTWTTLRNGGIRWRETFYSLDDLRRGRFPWR